ncbi:hypothetical protein J26TS2_11420 [Shouchella clausii]|nr:hypothetical protein J26TS2_11420 [Shouchella clausii]
MDTEKHKEQSLLSELEIIQLMSKHGVHTPELIQSRNKNTYEFVQEGNKSYYILAFSRVEGSILSNYEDASLIKQWGQTLGHMHEIAKNHANNNSRHFLEWNHDIDFDRFFEGSGQMIEDKWITFVDRLATMPTSNDVYGVVHHDLHIRNLLLSKIICMC